MERLHGLKAFGLHPELKNAPNQNVDLNGFSKTVELLRLLETIKTKEEKAIVFVMSRVAQDVLRFGIQTQFGIDVAIINGDNNSPAQVKDKLDGFKTTGGFAVIILSTLAAGLGLTITEANHVIHYERWWNASKEDQASDRAYRIGATRDVYIHHIIGILPRVDAAQMLSFDQALNQLIAQKRKTAGYLVPPKNIQVTEIITQTMQAALGEKIAAMGWHEFESLVKRLYEAQGYACDLTPNYPACEYGADIVAKKNGLTVVIQCKHSQHHQTKDETAIYQLQEVAKGFYKADQLIAVTNSRFSLSAKELARKYGIEVIEKEALEQSLSDFQVDI